MKLMHKSKVVQELITEGLALIENKYGIQSKMPLAYHNKEHAHDVMDASQTIGYGALAQGKITKSDLELLELAACYHDAEHGMHGSENEYESIHILTSKMTKTGAFSRDDIVKVTAMIEATIVSSAENGIVQSATDNYITQIMADADLSAFGKPFETFWNRSKKYLLEHSSMSFEDLSPTEQKAYIISQIKILQIRNYYTLEANDLYHYVEDNVKKLFELKG